MNSTLLNVKEKFNDLNNKVSGLIDQTNNILNVSTEFGQRFIESTDKLLNEHADKNFNFDTNDSFLTKNLEFCGNMQQFSNESLHPYISKDINILFDFNLAMDTVTNLKTFENLANITAKLNHNLTNLLKLFVEKMDPYFTQMYIKFNNESCVFKQNNNLLCSELNIASKPIYCPGFTWDILNILNVIREHCNDNRQFLENKKKYLDQNKFTTLKNGHLFENFWQTLTVNKANSLLNTFFTILPFDSCKKNYRTLLDDLKYLKSLLLFIKNTTDTMSFLNDQDILSEFSYLAPNLDSFSTNHDLFKSFYSNQDDIIVLPISQLKRTILSGTGHQKYTKKMRQQKETPLDYIAQHPDLLIKKPQDHKNHDKKHVPVKPVNYQGEHFTTSEEYSNLINDLYAPFSNLLANDVFNIYTSEYKIFQTFNFEQVTFTNFVEKISNFDTFWKLVSNIFKTDTIDHFNEKFLNAMCFDLSKTTFIVANSILLKTDIQNDSSNHTTLLNIIENNPQLFPISLSIRDVGCISSYLSEYHNDDSYKMCTIVNEHIYDSILLAPHIQITVIYCYGYFLKYLKHMAYSTPKNTKLETNIYMFCLKLLDNSVANNNSPLTTEGEITLVIYILNKFMDFIYLALKMNKEHLYMSNSTEIKSNGHLTIETFDEFEKYLFEFISAANRTVNTVCLQIFNYTTISHENSLLFLSKIQSRNLAQLFLDKIAIVDLIKKPIACLNDINKHILYFLYANCREKLIHNNNNNNINDTNTEEFFLNNNFRLDTNLINNNNNNNIDQIIKNPNPFALGEKEKEKPLDIYSSLPTTESYMKYYKSLGEKIGKEILKINLDKINKCFVDTTEPYRTQFAEPPTLELSLENNSSQTHPNLISSLYNIEITVNLLENLTTCSTLVSSKIIKLMESIWNQKCFQFTHTLALLNFHKNKKYYIFNNLDGSPSSISFHSYLSEILDDTCLFINIKSLLDQITTNSQITIFLDTHLPNFKFYLFKNFAYTQDSSCTDHYLNILKPIQITRLDFQFYLGIYILFIWHSIFNKSIL